MEIILQPLSSVTLVDRLTAALAEESYQSCYAAIAYARLSGVSLLAHAIAKFVNQGKDFRLVLGIDQRNTSYEALTGLLELLGSDSLFINHDPRWNITFHPKLWYFEGEADALLVVGSGNLTGGGLSTNDEAILVRRLDLSVYDDAELARSSKETLERWYDEREPSVASVSQELLDQLRGTGLILSEAEMRVARRREKGEGSADKTASAGTGMFEPSSYPRQRPSVRRAETGSVGVAEPESKKRVVDNSQGEIPPETSSQAVLIRQVPRAGNRTSQVHFTRSIIEGYFGARRDDSKEIGLVEEKSTGELGEREVSHLVYSSINMNPKFEVRGARVLAREYPTTGQRPLIVFRRIGEDRYVYSLLLPGDEGFSELTEYLESQPRQGRGLASLITTTEEVAGVWPEYLRRSR